MRISWIFPVFGALLLAAAAAGDETQEGGFQPVEGEAPAVNSSEFQPRQPLGAFQPTDIADPQPEPEPPGALSPAPDATPLRDKPAPLSAEEPSQTVAPAQFQSPLQPKTKTEPKTTIVPAASAPAFQTPPGNQSPPAAGEPQNLPQSLYQQSLVAPPTGAVEGTAMTLEETLTRRIDPSRYAEFVKSYWGVSQSVARYHDALQSNVELAQIPSPRAPYQQALLQAARASAEAEVRQAKLAAVTSQWELAEQMSGDAPLPLPSDVPLTAAYKSKFEAVFAGRTPPQGARGLDATFAPRLALIEGRAAAVVAAENAFAAGADAYAKGQVDISAALAEHARLQSARREFLASVYDYNVAIADYAWLAAGPNRAPETIAGMLVERRKESPASIAGPAKQNVVQKP
jgi:hypothetical protein